MPSAAKKLDQPVALVTGAGRGLGRAIAIAFARRGFAVAVHCRADRKSAQETLAEIESAGGTGALFQADVRSSSEVNAMMKALGERWGRLDVLVNNAGLARNRTLFKMSDDEWRDVIATNLDGSFYCSRAALPLLRGHSGKGGAIINLGSYIAERGAYGAGNYAAAKAGIIALTKALALEEGSHNVRANVILPGFHVTDMNRGVWEKMEPQIRSQHLIDRMSDRGQLADFAVQVALLETVSGQVFAFESRLL
jgi:3-oxoacyl-[acyl-carrier protein] reductase